MMLSDTGSHIISDFSSASASSPRVHYVAKFKTFRSVALRSW